MKGIKPKKTKTVNCQSSLHKFLQGNEGSRSVIPDLGLIMNLEQIQEMWKKDSVIDNDLYCEESTKIPQLHMRYMELYTTFGLMKKEREIEMKRLIREKWIYYGKAPSSVYKELPFDYKLLRRKKLICL